MVIRLSVRALERVADITALAFHAIDPSVDVGLDARSVTSRLANSLAKDVTETFEVEAVANHFPVEPKNAPFESTEPETTFSVSA